MEKQDPNEELILKLPLTNQPGDVSQAMGQVSQLCSGIENLIANEPNNVRPENNVADEKTEN